MYSYKSLTSQIKKIQYTARLFHATSSLGMTKSQGAHEGKVAVCVACTEGLGFQMAKRLAEDGAHVVVGSRGQEKVDKAVEQLKSDGLKASGVACHVGNAEQRMQILKTAAGIQGGIDILVNNAGVNAFHGPMLKTSESAFKKAFDVNVSACFHLVQEAVPYMKNQSSSSSIVITSSTAALMAQHYPGAYVVSKGALYFLVRALMPELLENNIRINCVALGIFKTAFAEAITENEHRSKLARDYLTPMKRFGEPEESAGIVSFLCSKDASYITGGKFSVNGGLTD